MSRRHRRETTGTSASDYRRLNSGCRVRENRQREGRRTLLHRAERSPVVLDDEMLVGRRSSTMLTEYIEMKLRRERVSVSVLVRAHPAGVHTRVPVGDVPNTQVIVTCECRETRR